MKYWDRPRKNDKIIPFQKSWLASGLGNNLFSCTHKVIYINQDQTLYWKEPHSVGCPFSFKIMI